MLTLHLLGQIEIWLDGTPLRGFESHKALALVCYLAYMNEPVQRRNLARLFWGEKDEPQGLANLSRVLHYNRKLLPGCLEGAYKTIFLHCESGIQLDTDEFDALARSGDGNALAAAAALYRGDFMSGITPAGSPEFETWLLGEQELWRKKVSQLYRQLADASSHWGHYDEAIQWTGRMLALDPWREETHRSLMTLLALNGERTAALRQYLECEQILAEELSIAPSEETRALYERIRRGGPVASSSAAAPEQPAIPLSSEADLTPGPAQAVAARLLHPACRLLTVLIPNGDPDALARQAAEAASDAFRDGVTFFHPNPAEPLESLLRSATDVFELERPEARFLYVYLREKEALLVLLDAGPELTSFIDGIIRRAPWVKVLAVSGEPLGLALEWLYEADGTEPLKP